MTLLMNSTEKALKPLSLSIINTSTTSLKQQEDSQVLSVLLNKSSLSTVEQAVTIAGDTTYYLKTEVASTTAQAANLFLPTAAALSNLTTIRSDSATETTTASHYGGGGGVVWNVTDPYAFTDESSSSFVIPFEIQLLMCLFYGALAFTAVTSNMIVCYIVLSNQKMRTATNYFIINLAVGDILMALLCIPFTFPTNLIQYWPFGLGLCIIVSYSQTISVFISAYTMVAISIDKYMAIMYPMRLRMTKIQAKIIILIIWSAALITSLPTALLSSLIRASPDSIYLNNNDIATATASLSSSSSSSTMPYTYLNSILDTTIGASWSKTQATTKGASTENKIYYSVPAAFEGKSNNSLLVPGGAPAATTTTTTTTTQATMTTENAQQNQAQRKYFCQESWSFWPAGKYYYSMALMILQFVLPLFVLVITYTRIVIIVWGKRIPGEEDNARDARMARSKRKMIKMVILCVIAFALTWLPFNALMVTGDMFPDIWAHQNIMHIWFLTHYLAMCHTITNPLIYIYMNNRFRSGFKQVLGNLLCFKMCSFVWYNCCGLACLSSSCSGRKSLCWLPTRSDHLHATNPLDAGRGSDNSNNSTAQRNRNIHNNKTLHRPPGAGGGLTGNSNSATTRGADGASSSTNGAAGGSSGVPASTTCSVSNTTRSIGAASSRNGPGSASGSSRTTSARTSSSRTSATVSLAAPKQQVNSQNVESHDGRGGTGATPLAESDSRNVDELIEAPEGVQVAQPGRKATPGARKRKGHSHSHSHAVSIQMVSKEFFSNRPRGGAGTPLGRNGLEFDLRQWSQSTATNSAATNLTSLDQHSAPQSPMSELMEDPKPAPQGGLHTLEGVSRVKGSLSLSWPANEPHLGLIRDASQRYKRMLPSQTSSRQTVAVPSQGTEPPSCNRVGVSGGLESSSRAFRHLQQGLRELSSVKRENGVGGLSQNGTAACSLPAANRRAGSVGCCAPSPLVDGRDSGTDEDICALDAFRSLSQLRSRSPLAKSLTNERSAAALQLNQHARPTGRSRQRGRESLELLSDEERDDEEDQDIDEVEVEERQRDVDGCSSYSDGEEENENEKSLLVTKSSSSQDLASGDDSEYTDDTDSGEQPLELMPLRAARKRHSQEQAFEKDRWPDQRAPMKPPASRQASRLHLLRHLFRSTGDELCWTELGEAGEASISADENGRCEVNFKQADGAVNMVRHGLVSSRRGSDQPQHVRGLFKDRSLRRAMLLNNHLLSSLSKLPSSQNGQLEEPQVAVCSVPGTVSSLLQQRQVAPKLTHQSSSHLVRAHEQDGA